jgi:hypothetical protein
METLQLLCSRHYCPANIPQLNCCSNWLTPQAGGHLTPTSYWILLRVRVRVRVILQLAVYRKSVPLGDNPLETHDQHFLTEHLRLQSLCNILSDKRMDLSFRIAGGPRQRSHFRVWDPRYTTIFYCLSFETSPFVASYDSPPPHGNQPFPRQRVHSQ